MNIEIARLWFVSYWWGFVVDDACHHTVDDNSRTSYMHLTICEDYYEMVDDALYYGILSVVQ